MKQETWPGEGGWGQAAAAAAPPRLEGAVARAAHLLTLSAVSRSALARDGATLKDHLAAQPDVDLADMAYTLAIGRPALGQRCAWVVPEHFAPAVGALDEAWRGTITGDAVAGRSVAFLFCGAGSQYVGMGVGLYQTEPVYRAVIDRCVEVGKALAGVDLAPLLTPTEQNGPKLELMFERPSLALPALFAVQVAMARLWMSWGIRPSGMIGHSAGEYAAAHLADVLTLEDAMRLMQARGRLFEGLAPGGMLSVALSEDELRPRLASGVSIAAINGVGSCVASGADEAIGRLADALAADGIESQRVRISVAAHSCLLDDVLDEFRSVLRSVTLRAPRRAFVSNLTGDWIRADEAVDIEYWVRHMRETVRFSDGLARLMADPAQILLEVGPGRAVASLARQHPRRSADQPVLNSMRHPSEALDDSHFALTRLGALWTSGVTIDWDGYCRDEPRHLLSLPAGLSDGRHGPRDGEEALPASALDGASPSSRPRVATPTERAIAEIWSELLGVADIGPADDFFDLGGHSLLAVQFANRLRKRTGMQLPLSALLEDASLGALAAILDAPAMGTDGLDAERRDPAIRGLVTIREGGARPPLFMVHDGLGETLLYRSLALRLDDRHPVYGIEPVRNPDGRFVHTRIDEMAAAYADRIVQAWPRGPYLLAGLCAGGVLAFETAQMLQARGKDVAFVGIFDGADIGAARRPFHVSRERIRRTGELLASTRPLGILTTLPRRLFNLVRWEVASRLDRLRQVQRVDRMRAAGVPAAGKVAPVEAMPFLQLYQVARAAHRPRGLFVDGEVSLYRATRGDGTPDDVPYADIYRDCILGWGKRVAKEVRLVPVPGGHSSMLRAPHVDMLAALLQQHVDLSLAGRRQDARAPDHILPAVPLTPGSIPADIGLAS